MVIDTSALIAILFGEPEAEAFSRALADDPRERDAFGWLRVTFLPGRERGVTRLFAVLGMLNCRVRWEGISY